MIESFNRKKAVGKVRQQQDHQRKSQLKREALAHDQERHQIGDCQLREDILKAEDDVSGTDAIQRPSEEQEQKRSLDRMKRDGPVRVSLLEAVGNGKRNGHTDDKHEEGLYQVPEVQSIPLVMAELRPDKLHYRTILHRPDVAVQPRAFADEEKHGDTPKQIHRRNPLRDQIS